MSATDLRSVVWKAQIASGRAPSDVARCVAVRCGCNPETVRRYLRGTNDTTTAILSAILDELGLVVRPR